MRSLIIFTALLATISALHIPLYDNYGYHIQDGLGQYAFGYSGGPSSKAEMRSWDGTTTGTYSYVDANGIVQRANYVSDPLLGFRIAATNLPVAPKPASPLLVEHHLRKRRSLAAAPVPLKEVEHGEAHDRVSRAVLLPKTGLSWYYGAAPMATAYVDYAAMKGLADYYSGQPIDTLGDMEARHQDFMTKIRDDLINFSAEKDLCTQGVEFSC